MTHICETNLNRYGRAVKADLPISRISGRPRLLDLFCGAGGCAVGYDRAGFDVTGVDNRPQPRYPFAFHQADALEFLAQHGAEFDAIHASPPCQAYTSASFTGGNRERHPDLLPATRSSLEAVGRPWVIENVYGSPLARGSIMLCGLMFGLKVFRHRWFESSFMLMTQRHPTHRGKRIGVGGMCCVIGHGGGPNYRTRLRGEADNKAAWQKAMGIDWMTRDQMSQAIPPAYTEFIGRQLIVFFRNPKLSRRPNGVKLVLKMDVVSLADAGRIAHLSGDQCGRCPSDYAGRREAVSQPVDAGRGGTADFGLEPLKSLPEVASRPRTAQSVPEDRAVVTSFTATQDFAEQVHGFRDQRDLFSFAGPPSGLVLRNRPSAEVQADIRRHGFASLSRAASSQPDESQNLFGRLVGRGHDQFQVGVGHGFPSLGFGIDDALEWVPFNPLLIGGPLESRSDRAGAIAARGDAPPFGMVGDEVSEMERLQVSDDEMAAFGHEQAENVGAIDNRGIGVNTVGFAMPAVCLDHVLDGQLWRAARFLLGSEEANCGQRDSLGQFPARRLFTPAGGSLPPAGFPNLPNRFDPTHPPLNSSAGSRLPILTPAHSIQPAQPEIAVADAVRKRATCDRDFHPFIDT